MNQSHQQYEAYKAWMTERGLTPPPPSTAAANAAVSQPIVARSAPTLASAMPHPAANNLDELARYRDKAAHCRSCQNWAKRQKAVWGTGSLQPKLVLITDAPSAHGCWFQPEEQELLVRMLAAMKLTMDDIFTTGLVLCPKPAEQLGADAVLSCREFLLAQLRHLPDTPMVVLGADAALNFSGINGDFTTNIGRWHHHATFPNRPLRVIYHPRDMVQSADLKRPTWSALQEVMKTLRP